MRLTEQQYADMQRRSTVATAIKAVKKSKYRNVRCQSVDGKKFDSKIELARWQELKLLELAGEIYALSRQVPYELKVRGVLIGRYLADFQYTTGSGDACQLIVEDTKGMDTPLSRWKRKHLKAQEGIEVWIVRQV